MLTFSSTTRLIDLGLFSNTASWQEKILAESPVISSRKQGRRVWLHSIPARDFMTRGYPARVERGPYA